MLNNALRQANIRNAEGAQIEVTAASYQDRNTDQEPQIKEGPTVTRKKRRGQPSDRAAMNEAIKQRNEARQRSARTNNAPKPFTNQPDGATLRL
jgi:hypothetical protein